MKSEIEEMPQLADRRYALRQQCRVETLRVEHAVLGSVMARVLDISREGFRLEMPLSLPCGDEIVIHPPAGSDLLKIRATIVRQSVKSHNGEKVIESGAEVADSASWRKHNWFLELRVGADEGGDAQQLLIVTAAA